MTVTLQRVDDSTSEQNNRLIEAELNRQRPPAGSPGTTLPTKALFIGKQVAYKAATGVYWNLLYTGEETYPWAKIGGPPLYTFSNTTRELTNQTTFVSLPTDPLAITIPAMVMECDITIASNIQQLSASGLHLGRISYSMGATAAENAWSAAAQNSAQFDSNESVKVTRQTLTSGAKVEEKALTGGNYTMAYTRRRLLIDPVRVG